MASHTTRFRAQFPEDWPEFALLEAYDVAVRLNAAMTRAWAVWDVELDAAVEEFNTWVQGEVGAGGSFDAQASDAWIEAWEDGATDAPLREALGWYYRNH